ncbi:aromatic aminobenezylarsenical efflux permease ArsG family transporter [Candidatus Hydrogenedentota bacterium]
MIEWSVASATALWLGILTSISPCPLASNIAAVSFIGRRLDSPRSVFLSGGLYTLGRSLTYVVLAVLLVYGLLSAPILSHWLQKNMNRLLGPILVLAGMFLLELLHLGMGNGKLGQWIQKRTENGSMLSALPMGIVFALSFCPVSAALFFATLIPLSIKQESPILLPVLYGIGTALPVFVFSLLIGVGAGKVALVFNQVKRVELWARRLTGGIFIGLGIYLTLAHTLDVF